jgi:subtilase family serine protease
MKAGMTLKKKMRRLSTLIAPIVLVVSLWSPLAWAQPKTTALPQHIHPALKRLIFEGRAERTRVLDLVVGLSLQNQPALDAILTAQHDPTSPWFHRWLTPEEFAAQFSPTEQAHDNVVRWLRSRGLTVTQTWPNRLMINASGSVAQVEAALGISINRYRRNGQTFHANAQDPQIPTELAVIVSSIQGLEDLSQLKPRLSAAPHITPDTPRGLLPKLKLGSTTLFGPKDLYAAYNFTPLFNAGSTGAGQKIAIATAYTFNISDINRFEQNSGLPKSPSSRFQWYFPTGKTNKLGDETTLDVEWSSAMAPSAKIQGVIGKNALLSTFTTIYNFIVTNLSSTRVVSTSWGLCEVQMPSAVMTTDNNIFKQGAAQGQSWFAASGDFGADDCGNGGTTPEVDFPASSPFITAVGGTLLTTPFDGSGTATGYGSETAWNGSGGGKSLVFGKPTYQIGVTPADGTRHLPDVSLEAGPTPGNLLVFNGRLYRAWGTSLAAPQWAGLFAIVNQIKGGTGLGNANPRLYSLGVAANGFYDVTTGNNSYGTTTGFLAGPGYDQVTGWGSYNAYQLAISY